MHFHHSSISLLSSTWNFALQIPKKLKTCYDQQNHGQNGALSNKISYF